MHAHTPTYTHTEREEEEGPSNKIDTVLKKHKL
jgi:hypothetical protein